MEVKTDFKTKNVSTESLSPVKSIHVFSISQDGTPITGSVQTFTTESQRNFTVLSGLENHVHELTHPPEINTNVIRIVESNSNIQNGIEEGYVTPQGRTSMHQKEVLKTPKKHERITEAELSQEYESETKRKSTQNSPTKSNARSSVLASYRDTIFPEFDIVDDLPDRSNLISCINQTLQESPGRESLLVMPERISILRSSRLSPAKIEVQYLLKEKYEDGSLYEGEGRAGLRHGHGKIYYPDGMTFEGEFQDGKMSGYGVLAYENGKVCYQGDYLNDKFEGEGVLYNETLVELVGPFDYRNFDNLGNYWLKYEGKFKNDMKHGVGTLYLINGERYYGEFKNDRVHGKGIFYVFDASAVSGEWEDNRLKELF